MPNALYTCIHIQAAEKSIKAPARRYIPTAIHLPECTCCTSSVHFNTTYQHLVSCGPIHAWRFCRVIFSAHSTGLAVTACAPG